MEQEDVLFIISETVKYFPKRDLLRNAVFYRLYLLVYCLFPVYS